MYPIRLHGSYLEVDVWPGAK